MLNPNSTLSNIQEQNLNNDDYSNSSSRREILLFIVCDYSYNLTNNRISLINPILRNLRKCFNCIYRTTNGNIVFFWKKISENREYKTHLSS